MISRLAVRVSPRFRRPLRRHPLARAGAALALTVGAVAALAVPPATGKAPPPVSNWVLDSTRQFAPLVGSPTICGGQGIASDGESLWLSWNFGLSRHDLAMTTTFAADCTGAIPQTLRNSGHNHIGDIDVHDGILYAPIEDGGQYLSPWIALYDADTLRFTGRAFELDREYLTEGVPWVAIDGPRKVAYTAEWNDTTRLNVHRLADFKLVRTVELDKTVPRIQGAKVFRGSLYVARDNRPAHSVEAIDPETGHVTHLFDRPELGGSEAEGIAFVRQRTGVVMSLLELHQGAQVRNFRINGDTTPPRLKGLKLRPRRVRAGRQPAKLKLSVRSSEPVTATGRWLRCAGPKRKPCRKLKATGKPFARNLTSGANRFRLRTVTGGKALKPGLWRLRLTPVDEADITGRPAHATLRVRPAAKRR